MNFPKRIFVLPIGFEWTRLLFFPQDVRADKCYLITQKNTENKKDNAREQVQLVKQSLQDNGNTVEVIGLDDFFDLFDIMACYRWIAEKHEDDALYINCGGGSKLSAMGGMIISGMYENISCYYPKSQVTEPGDPTVVSTTQDIVQVEETLILPKFSIKRFDDDFLPVLEFLKGRGPTVKKDLLLYLTEDVGLIKTTFTPNDENEPRERSDQSLYNILKRNFVDPMINDNLISEEDGRIGITPNGENMLKIFGKDSFEKINV